MKTRDLPRVCTRISISLFFDENRFRGEELHPAVRHLSRPRFEIQRAAKLSVRGFSKAAAICDSEEEEEEGRKGLRVCLILEGEIR